MYLERMYYKNVGPIDEIDYTFRKDENGNPIPVVIVGKNGSGKSILLSNIIDAFYEIADQKFRNAIINDGVNHYYYKVLSDSQIKIKEHFLVSHLIFTQDSKRLEYLYKIGKLTFNEYKKLRNNDEINSRLDWHDKESEKTFSVEDEFLIDLEQKTYFDDCFNKNIVCYFGPDRFFKPSWMSKKYFGKEEDISSDLLNERYTGELINPITAMNISELTIEWVKDVVNDSKEESKNLVEKFSTLNKEIINDYSELNEIRLNLEKILSIILGEQIIFWIKNRSYGIDQLTIIKKDSGEVLIKNLSGLSTGQLALFHLFATIIRYADRNDIKTSTKLDQIQGIVVIDEIDLHLHTQLQAEALPNLIKLFPKVQFIITSHSPLFLLGIKEQFGDDIDILEMPAAQKIAVEDFSDFNDAFETIKKTEVYKKEIKTEIEKNNIPLIITEGTTDWKHMKAAYEKLKENLEYANWLPTLGTDFEFFEYKPEDYPKLEMGGEQLLIMCKDYAKLPQKQKLIFIADDDVKKVKSELGCDNEQKYKSWGNGVYSFTLPVPEHRKETPEISIEHYYSDEVIKCYVKINDINYRLFFGNEFDDDGFSLDNELFCRNKNKCGLDKIGIIDGQSNSRIYQIKDKTKTNIALSKMKFADLILQKKFPAEIDFLAFVPLFKIINNILHHTEN